MKNRLSPEINAGSTADIAFLLLMFFLISTTFPNEKGITRKLPRICDSPDCSIPIKERNILRITMNNEGLIVLDEVPTPAESIHYILREFIDNNGDGHCTYCQGLKKEDLSEHPMVALISITVQRETPYESYVFLQNEINRAYAALRQEYAKTYFKKDLEHLSGIHLKETLEAYPIQISEATLK